MHCWWSYHYFQNQVMMRCCVTVTSYSIQLDWTSNTSGQKIICQRTRRATAISRPPLESSRQGKFRSFGFYFLWSFFDLLFFKTSEKMIPFPIKEEPGRFGFALSNTCLPRSRALLRCVCNWPPAVWDTISLPT